MTRVEVNRAVYSVIREGRHVAFLFAPSLRERSVEWDHATFETEAEAQERAEWWLNLPAASKEKTRAKAEHLKERSETK